MNQNIRLYNPTSKKINWVYIIGYLIIFLFLPPFIGLPLIIGMMWKKTNASITDYYTFFFCIAAYFAAINATKALDGDQINYCWAYLNVPTQGFIGSLKNIYGYAVAMGGEGAANISGEFMNGVYNYVGYYLTFGYYPLFAACLTFADYFFIFVGLYKYAQSLNKPHVPIVCGVLILSFFYLFFNFTLQIQKQFLAQSIMMYVLGTYAYEGKMSIKLWSIAFISFFTHASMILFFPFLYFKRFIQKINRNTLFIMAAIFMLLIIIGPSLIGNTMTENNSALTYGMNRITNSEGEDDGAGGVALWRLIVVGGPLMFIVIKALWFGRKALNNKEAFILNVALMLILAILAMYNKPLAQYRYFMMVYAFMPFILPFISEKIRKRNYYLKLVSILMVVWFYFQFEKIIWHYAPELHIMGVPPIGLIFSNYPGL